MPCAATQMDLENIMLSEISQSEKDKYYMIPLLRESKNNTNESIYKREADSQTQKQYFHYQSGGGWRDKLGV